MDKFFASARKLIILFLIAGKNGFLSHVYRYFLGIGRNLSKGGAYVFHKTLCCDPDFKNRSPFSGPPSLCPSLRDAVFKTPAAGSQRCPAAGEFSFPGRGLEGQDADFGRACLFPGAGG